MKPVFTPIPHLKRILKRPAIRQITVFGITATSCLFIIFHSKFLPFPYMRNKANAAAVAIPEPPGIRKRNQKCHSDGDGDIYGLGVRIGLYLQWAAGFILRNLGSWERVSRVRTASNILCSSLVVAEVIEIVSGTALSIDYLLSYYLTIALFYAESYNLVYERPDQKDTLVYKLYPDLPLVFQNLYFAAYTLFGVWFWISGIHRTMEASCPEQAAIVFTFDLHDSRWIHAAAAISLLSGLLFFLFFAIHLQELAHKGLVHKHILEPLVWLDGISGSTDHMHRRIPIDFIGNKEHRSLATAVFDCFHYTMIYLTGPLIAITSVERMISVNNLVTPGISGSSGQVIALFTGCVSMGLAI
ncbi:hypothetical protein OCU04_002226 [Sclerotinia nivalis]|uniref:Uncharacterized protein n=1 Tax=Sclerotinia nivalis TaxID=352851 RepID=A0A9X0AZP3_9HELO|nr:hypothetical protein OCU04_002226 [Sclerotinia nivalis]